MKLRFSRGTGVPAAIVRFATWSWCAHVGFKLDNGLVLDATPDLGVALHEVQDDASTRYYGVIGPEDRIDTIRRLAIAWASRKIGRRYDWTAIYGMAIRRDWHRDDKWFCSELVEGAFSAAGMPLVQDGHKLDRITPRDLLLSPLLAEVAR